MLTDASCDAILPIINVSWPPLCVDAVVFAVVATDVHALNSLNATIIIINLLIDGQTVRSFGLGRRHPLLLFLSLSLCLCPAQRGVCVIC